MILFKKNTAQEPLTDQEKELEGRIKKVHWKLFPWTLINIVPGILIGYFTWFYYVKVVLDKRITLGDSGGIEKILGFLLLYIAPVFSILGLISISVTIIAKLTYRPLIAKHYYDERKVNIKLWNTSVIINACVAVITLVAMCLL
jgi:hypothetical protein